MTMTGRNVSPHTRAGTRITRLAVAAGLGTALLIPASGTAAAPPAAGSDSSDAVLRWNANAGAAAMAACVAPSDNPLHESRMYAMTHIAVHDALNAIDRRFTPYAYDGSGPATADPQAAVAAAARTTLVSALGDLTDPFTQECIDAGAASVEADYAEALAEIPDGAAETDGIAVGEAAAAAIIALRAGDGSDTLLLDESYPQGTEPGEYRFTPGQTFAFAPGWADVTTFVLEDSSEFQPGPPLPLDSRRYAGDLNEVKKLGGDDVTTPSQRTEDQTQIAYFWLESSPLAWNRLSRTVAASQGLDLWENARLFGLVNMALADGYVGSWDTKYEERFWRPVTAIQEADTDGNPRTAADPTWTPLVGTPPIPEYDSAHAVEGGAAAAVLRKVFGTDRVAFEACSLTLPDAGDTCDDPTPALRHYDGFAEAAGENAVSRIYIGFHFRDAVETGEEHGSRIGKAAVRRYMQPLYETP